MKNHPRQKYIRDNRANQLNPEHNAYHRSRGASPKEAGRLARLRKKHDVNCPRKTKFRGEN